MTTNSAIEWTDHTFNPWIGCAKIAAGCTHCYAETLMDTRYGRVQWGEKGTRAKTSKGNWAKVRKWDREAQATFGRKARVFCASLADVAEDRPELIPWRAELCDLIRECGNLDFQLLTKRPENLMRLFPADVLERCWLGTSISTQKDADQNIPVLLQCPAAVRFISAEPLIGTVCLQHNWTSHVGTFADVMAKDYKARCPKLDWVIVGGESGPGARPCDVAWIRSIVQQCKAAGAPVFVKQVGSKPRGHAQWEHPDNEGYGVDPELSPLDDRKGGDPAEWPEDLRVREFPEATRG